MQNEKINHQEITPTRYRFHPLVRIPMLTVGFLAIALSLYFIFFLIPRYQNVSLFFKLVSVFVLYVALSSVYRHLSSLNTILILPDVLQLNFLLRRTIIIPWERLLGMEIGKNLTHWWKIHYVDDKGIRQVFRTSLAFPGIVSVLLKIQDICPDIELNDLLRNVLLYKRKQMEINSDKSNSKDKNSSQ